MNLFFTLFLLLILWNPLESHAAQKTLPPLSINLETEIHESIVPGDMLTETFLIKNLSTVHVKVRLARVTNVEDSKLFSVLNAKWINDKDSSHFQALDTLTTDWITLSPTDSLPLKLQLYFPANCGNEFQNAELKALFLFEYQILAENTDKDSLSNIPIFVSHPTNREGYFVPSTGDYTKSIYVPLIVCFFSSSLLLRLKFKNKKSRSHHL